MKISVIGSHGTGKSTICKELSTMFNLNIIPDVVPEAFRKGFTINENTPPETQLWILTKQLELERNTPEDWIMEKSLWDNIIYGSLSIKDKKVLMVMEEIVNKNAKYDIVFYLPIEFGIEDDGLRSLDSNFQSEIDVRFKKYLANSGIKFIKLSGSIKERVRKAATEVKKAKSKSRLKK